MNLKKKSLHLAVSFYSSPNFSLKTVFTFYVAPPQKKISGLGISRDPKLIPKAVF